MELKEEAIHVMNKAGRDRVYYWYGGGLLMTGLDKYELNLNMSTSCTK